MKYEVPNIIRQTIIVDVKSSDLSQMFPLGIWNILRETLVPDSVF